MALWLGALADPGGLDWFPDQHWVACNCLLPQPQGIQCSLLTSHAHAGTDTYMQKN